MAAVAHLVWPLLNDSDAWWTRILKQKYLRTTSLEDCVARRSDSRLWKAVLKAKALILEHQRWVIGDGRSVRLLDDHWVPGMGILRPHLLSEPQTPSPLQYTTRPPR